MRIAFLAAALSLSAGAALAQTPPAAPAASVPAPSAAGPSAPATPAAGAPTPEMRAARQAMRDACAADIKTFCPDTAAGGGRPGQCFREHAADLSPTCKDAVAKMRAERRNEGGGLRAPKA